VHFSPTQAPVVSPAAHATRPQDEGPPAPLAACPRAGARQAPGFGVEKSETQGDEMKPEELFVRAALPVQPSEEI